MDEQTSVSLSARDRPLHLLLVDDDVELCGMMQAYFAQSGCRLDCAHNGRDGLALAAQGPHDLVLLDVMLPAVDGFSVLQRLRRRCALPVIMLTARVDHADRIAGLDKGADDYLTKPFDPEELLARIRAVLRRARPPSGRRASVRCFGDIEVDVQTREARVGGEALDLTALEFDILEMLTRSPGRAVSRDEITLALLDRAVSPYDRALDVHISHLRDKLGRRNLIGTVRGVGYVFTGDPVGDPESAPESAP